MDNFAFDPTSQDIFTEGSHLIDELPLRAGNSRSTNSEDILPPNFASRDLTEVAKYGGYSTYSSQSNTDPFVRQSLKLYDRELYDSIYGYTRRPRGTMGMYDALKKFSGERSSFRDLNRKQQRAMNKAIGLARKAFKLHTKVEPRDWHDIGQFLRRDTSAGVSFMGQKKGDVMPDIYHKARWLAHRMKQDPKQQFNPTKVKFPPCLAGQRGHLSERDDPKTRLVWIYPAEMLVIEGQYAPDMYRKYMDDPHSPMLNGKSSQRLFTEWTVGLQEGEVLYGLDFKGFDTKVPPWLIRVAFSILHENIEWETWRGKPVSAADRQKWRNVWDGMVWYFINTVILMPDGRMFRKRRGVPSGSWWTQMVDSIVNYVLVKYLGICQRQETKNTKVLGDDSGFRNNGSFSLEQAHDDSHDVGMVLNTDKCDRAEDPRDFKLLGTKYRSGHVHREDDEWFKLALYPESAVNTVDLSLTRLIGLWIGGGMWSQRFSDFVTYFQTCYQCPEEGWFSKDQRRWLEVVFSGKSPRGWTTKKSLFWRAIFYAF